MPRYKANSPPRYSINLPPKKLPNRVVTVERYGSKMATVRRGLSFPIWIMKIYDVDWRLAEQPDGTVTVQPRTRLAAHQGRSVSGRYPSNRFVDECESCADDLGLPFVPEVRHNAPLSRAFVEQMQKNYRRRVAPARPHGLCERAGRCIEHERDSRVEACR